MVSIPVDLLSTDSVSSQHTDSKVSIPVVLVLTDSVSSQHTDSKVSIPVVLVLTDSVSSQHTDSKVSIPVVLLSTDSVSSQHTDSKVSRSVNHPGDHPDAVPHLGHRGPLNPALQSQAFKIKGRNSCLWHGRGTNKTSGSLDQYSFQCPKPPEAHICVTRSELLPLLITPLGLTITIIRSSFFWESICLFRP
ncbi:hypothetical protein RRG08_012238 [Elysia crispata]|uniref:Uncharacterized protein n=1 Tax=Elysia crispata TaxID=231223 RepID=A0AAE0YPV6_9GAST|nr:hypothetical protein RRG08_012238 [Elysia crispata]